MWLFTCDRLVALLELWAAECSALETAIRRRMTRPQAFVLWRVVPWPCVSTHHEAMADFAPVANAEEVGTVEQGTDAANGVEAAFM